MQPPIQDLFKTDLVFAQQRGELQLNAFPTYASGAQESWFSHTVGLEYGITDALQLDAEWGAYLDTQGADPQGSGSGQGNLSLGLMYSMMDLGSTGLHVAAGFDYEFASGDSRFLDNGNREDSQGLYLIFAKDLDEDYRSRLFLQIGVELQGNGGHAPSPATGWPETDNAEDVPQDSAQDDEAHDPNVWFANLGGYTVWR